MYKKYWIDSIIAAGLLALVIAGCTGTGSKNPKSSQAAVKPTTDTVTIAGMKFNPDTLLINKGDTVVWINNGIVAHNVTEYPGQTWKSDSIQPGQTWEKVFSDSISYFCTIHPTMKGKIMIRQ